MKLSELISGPDFYGEVVILKPDKDDKDETKFHEAYRGLAHPLQLIDPPSHLLNYDVREISCGEGEELRHAFYIYCTPQ